MAVEHGVVHLVEPRRERGRDPDRVPADDVVDRDVGLAAVETGRKEDGDLAR